MKNTTILIGIIFFINIGNLCFSQNLIWAKSTGSAFDDISAIIAIDNSGNIYITGYFRDIVDFDFGPGTSELTSVGNNDIYFAKYDSNGNILWAKSIGSSSDDEGRSITLDSSGNLYITGIFKDTADFDPGPGTANLVPVSNYDIFIAKFNNNGDYIWAKGIGSTSIDESYSIAVGDSGNVYITGFFSGTVDFDPGSGIATLTSIGWPDIFLTKFDTNGNYIWAIKISSSSSDEGHKLIVDNLDNIYITGSFFNDIFFAKYDNNGNNIWTRIIGSLSDDNGQDITIDTLGNLYLTGYFLGTVDFDPGPGIVNLTPTQYDIFLAKYDNNGNYIWAKSMGSTMDDHGHSIAVDELGYIYLAGSFRGTVDFNPGSGITNLTSNNSSDDIFFAQYDTSGNFLWVKCIGGPNFDDDPILIFGNSGCIYITGNFKDSSDFDPGTGTLNLTSVGNYDFFVAMYCKYAGVENLEMEKELQPEIYPNPANGIIHISNYSKTSDEIIVKIINTHGKLLIHNNLYKQNSIDVSNLTKGIYFVEIQTDKRIETRKLVIQ